MRKMIWIRWFWIEFLIRRLVDVETSSACGNVQSLFFEGNGV